MRLPELRNPAPNPAAIWLTVIGAKAQKPQKHECVGESRQGPLPDDLGLPHNFQQKLPYAPPQGKDLEIRRRTRAADGPQNLAQPGPGQSPGSGQQHNQKRFLSPGKAVHTRPSECSTQGRRGRRRMRSLRLRGAANERKGFRSKIQKDGRPPVCNLPGWRNRQTQRT